jgi:hypothetical protein
MIITYESRFSKGDRPRLCKVVRSETDQEGEVVTTLTLSNTEEIQRTDEGIIWDYMSKLVLYLKEEIESLTLIERGVHPNEGWPVLGWPRVHKINEEITSWWAYLEYKDEPIEIIHNVEV